MQALQEMKAFFQELFTYNHQMNQALFQRLAEKPDAISAKTTTLIGHILNAHQIWNNRILGQADRVGVWDTYPLKEAITLDIHNFELSLTLLENVPFEKEIVYTTTTGKNYQNTTQDILFHVINHSNYHRAQVATEMKLANISPISSDYIFYKRK